jgi:hypothetical protein
MKPSVGIEYTRKKKKKTGEGGKVDHQNCAYKGQKSAVHILDDHPAAEGCTEATPYLLLFLEDLPPPLAALKVSIFSFSILRVSIRENASKYDFRKCAMA